MEDQFQITRAEQAGLTFKDVLFKYIRFLPLFIISCDFFLQSSKGNLFPARGYEKIISHLLQEMPLEVFYGPFFGLHFNKVSIS